MTRDQFLADNRHTLMGVFIEGLVKGNNFEYAMWLRTMYAKIDAALGAAYDSLPKPVPQNGQVRKESAK